MQYRLRGVTLTLPGQIQSCTFEVTNTIARYIYMILQLFKFMCVHVDSENSRRGGLRDVVGCASSAAN